MNCFFLPSSIVSGLEVSMAGLLLLVLSVKYKDIVLVSS